MPPPVPAEDASVVLDAAAECYLRLGVTKTTAAHIAAAAGISRATLYRRFGSHEAIFLAVLERESAAMAAEAAAHLAGIEDPASRLVESMIFSIGQITSRPVHAAIFSGDSAAWAAGRAFRTEALRRIGETAVRPLLRPATVAGGLSDLEVADLVDWILRVLISYAAVPGAADRNPDDIRRQLTSLFLPGFASALRPR
jgi:AcrR family transcriptional regulator